MSSQLVELEGLNRQLQVTVSAEDLQKTYQKRVADFAKNAKLKGFRPGKVPAQVIEQKFGHGLLQESAAQLIESSLKTTLSEKEIRAAGMPAVDFDHQALKKGNGFTFTAKFEVYPTFQLKDLADVEIESVSGEVTEEDVNAALIKFRTQHAEWQEVQDRATKLGDKVTIDFDGTLEDKPLENGSAKNQSLELGSKSMIPGFEDGIIGMKKGETKTIQIAFPTEYHVEDLRGKPVSFVITLHDIKEPKLPALDEKFSEKLGFKDVETLKTKVKENLVALLKDACHAKLKQTTLNKLRELNPVLVPQALIDAEISHLQSVTRNQMRQYIGENKKIDVNKIPLSREPYVDEATKRVVLGMLLAEVIKQHSITIDQTKVQERLMEMASHYPNSSEIINIFTKNRQMMSDIEAYVLEEQAIDVLLKNARVTPVKKSYDAIVNS
ncbi:MAG: trigger factor [Gammaproteobacteria bacterium RIFCSPHIGHO2_12_FULL_42_13]|nr:MAG: trigger factor [Gammaproteobacteria bacterium RIFCSPHIGHO2_12_FULL_42_13]